MVGPRTRGLEHGRARLRNGVGAAAVVAFLIGVVAACQPIAGAMVTHHLDSSWSNGYQATVTVRNDAPIAVPSWQLQLTLPHHVSSTWDATVVSQSGSQVVFGHPSYAADIAPGQTVQFGYVADLAGARAEPTGCLLNGAPCTLVSTSGPTTTTAPASSTTASTASSTTSSSTTSTTTPGGGSGVPFAPYTDTTLWPPPNLAAMANGSGARLFTLGFIVNGSSACTPSWGGVVDPASGHMSSEIQALRAMGGDVIISFGGANGTELAQSCPTAAALTAAYQSVIDRYSLTSVDFDIEGGAISDTTATDRRSQAIKQLQANASAAGKHLDVSLTLPVLPSGLTAGGVSVVQSAAQRGVALAVVNIMAMDYGDGSAPNPEGQMGAYAIQSATSLHGQLTSIYPTLSAAQRWAMVGVTPMIGQNDAPSERFSVADAQQLRNEARAKGYGRLAMWSADRDKPCSGGPSQWASPTCSGITQSAWDFSHVFAS